MDGARAHDDYNAVVLALQHRRDRRTRAQHGLPCLQRCHTVSTFERGEVQSHSRENTDETECEVGTNRMLPRPYTARTKTSNHQVVHLGGEGDLLLEAGGRKERADISDACIFRALKDRTDKMGRVSANLGVSWGYPRIG
eukprot:3191680-Rhodomonas_salina.6